MITVHHLGISQSERIVWLCEELSLDYKLVRYVRDPFGAPASLKSLPGNEYGKAPFIEDSQAGITLSESGAIVEYLITKYGNGRLALQPENPQYPEYLHWFHFANGSIQLTMMCGLFVDLATGTKVTDGGPIQQLAHTRIHDMLKVLDQRLENNQWLAGSEFTAADIMSVFSLTTARYWGPLISLAPYANILRYLADCGARPGYQRAMEKGDPDMKPLLGAEPPSVDMMSAGGVISDYWKK